MVSRTLANLGLKAFWAYGEPGYNDEMDADFLKLSHLVQAGAVSKVAATPGAPTDGQLYIFDETHPTQANSLAIYDDSAWTYVTPQEGWLVYNRALDYFEKFDGAVWAEFASGGGATYPDFTGNAGRHLAVNLGETDVEWVSPIGGGAGATRVLVDSVVAAGTASVDLSVNSADYDEWVLVGRDVILSAAGAELGLQVGSGATPTFDAGTNYDFAIRWRYGTSGVGTLSSAFVSATTSLRLGTVSSASDAAGVTLDFDAILKNLATGKNMKLNHGFSDYDGAGGLTSLIFGGVHLNAAYDVSALRIIASSGNITSGEFHLFGIKHESSSGGVGAPFRGARLTRTSTLALSGATVTQVPFDSEDFDTDSFHDNVTNNTRLTIPAGIDFVEITAAIASITGLENDYSVWIAKNGDYTYPGMVGEGVRSLNGTRKGLALSTGPIPVLAGDYFELVTNNFAAETLTIAGTFLSAVVLAGSTGTVSAILSDATLAKTLALGDSSKYIRLTNAAAKTITVDDEATVPIPVSTEFHLRNVGAGDLTIAPDVAVTINVPAGGSLVLATGMSATLKKVASDEFDLIGQTVPA